MSVQLHYPEVFDGSPETYKRTLVIRQRTSLILNKDLIELLGWSGMSSRDKMKK
jgi:hypothetical protein